MSTLVSDRVVRLQMHLNLAIQYALMLGVVLGVSQYLLAPPDGRIAALEGGVQGGVLAGIVVSLIVGVWQWRSAAAARDRRLAADPEASATVNPGVRVEQTVRVPLSRSEILRRADSLAAAVDGGQVKAVDEAAGTIALATPIFAWGWGERIVITVAAGGADGLTPVTIASRPAVWGPSIDFGRNGRNVERVVAALAGTDKPTPNG